MRAALRPLPFFNAAAALEAFPAPAPTFLVSTFFPTVEIDKEKGNKNEREKRLKMIKSLREVFFQFSLR